MPQSEPERAAQPRAKTPAWAPVVQWPPEQNATSSAPLFIHIWSPSYSEAVALAGRRARAFKTACAAAATEDAQVTFAKSQSRLVSACVVIVAEYVI